MNSNAIDAKRILIISDTHGHLEAIRELAERFETPDLVIHCGDLECAPEQIEQIMECPVVAVSGNCDYWGSLPTEAEIQIGKYKIWITHGNRYFVNSTTGIITEMAGQKGADIVMYGHTHRPLLKQKKGITILNPGSLVFPRQEGRDETFAMMEIDDIGEAHFTILNL